MANLINTVPSVENLSQKERLRLWWKQNISEKNRQKVWECINIVRANVEMAYAEMATNYDSFDCFIQELEDKKIEGDVCEIGTFNGKGSGKLLKMIEGANRKLIVIDPFFDEDTSDRVAAKGYGSQKGLWKRSPEALFWFNVARQNVSKIVQLGTRVDLLVEDSMKVEFETDQKFAFSFIDGNHSAEYVRHDFEKMFEATALGGFIAMHDYKGPIAHSTQAIEKIIEDFSGKVEVADIIPEFFTIVFRKVNE